MHPDLAVTKKLLYDPCGFTCSSVELEQESVEYGASRFTVNSARIRFRVAKITPTKIGQFVTLWKRLGAGAIRPYDSVDDFDLVVISVKLGNNLGQFVFTKAILLEQGIIASNKKDGKLGFRVYPAWDSPVSKQAKKTQKWQLPYFLETPLNKAVSCKLACSLYCPRSCSI